MFKGRNNPMYSGSVALQIKFVKCVVKREISFVVLTTFSVYADGGYNISRYDRSLQKIFQRGLVS